MMFYVAFVEHGAVRGWVVLLLLGGATAAGGTARVLTGEIHAHNTFDAPATIGPAPFETKMQGSEFVVELPAASVAAFEIALV